MAGNPVTSSESAPNLGDVSRPGSLRVERLGTVSYDKGLELQADLVRQRRDGQVPDTLLLLQHPHVVTLGSGSHAENILLSDDELERRGISLFKAGRGGDVTYHGPGQLVGYPIIDLKPDRCDLHRYLRDLEEAMIRTLADFGLRAGRREGLTGAWVGNRKLAAIGVRVSSGWITSHGFALNISTDLSYFDAIVPCGIKEFDVGSIESETGAPVSWGDVESTVVKHLAAILGREPVEATRSPAGGSRSPPLPTTPPGQLLQNFE